LGLAMRNVSFTTSQFLQDMREPPGYCDYDRKPPPIRDNVVALGESVTALFLQPNPEHKQITGCQTSRYVREEGTWILALCEDPVIEKTRANRPTMIGSRVGEARAVVNRLSFEE
jgi:hypothetical protein